MDISHAPRFDREYKKIPEDIHKKAKLVIEIFRADPFDARLKTHKLHGRLADCWAFSIDYHYRIVFSFVSDSVVQFHTIGTHNIYE